MYMYYLTPTQSQGHGQFAVAESCEVALDIMQSEISGEFVPLVVEPTRAAA